MAEELKVCNKCHELKPLSLFFRSKITKDGRMYSCKKCNVAQKKEIIHKNSEYYKRKRKDRYKLYRDEDIQRSLEWNRNNEEKFRISKKRYVDNHPEKYKNHLYRLRIAISSGIRRMLISGKNRVKWSSLVGYDSDELRSNIESKFIDGMCWDNYGTYWEVDHIIPISYFGHIEPSDDKFKKCWALDNLRPLTVSENRSKGNKITTSIN